MQLSHNKLLRNSFLKLWKSHFSHFNRTETRLASFLKIIDIFIPKHTIKSETNLAWIFNQIILLFEYMLKEVAAEANYVIIREMHEIGIEPNTHSRTLLRTHRK